jgi:hypothetical protein
MQTQRIPEPISSLWTDRISARMTKAMADEIMTVSKERLAA